MRSSGRRLDREKVQRHGPGVLQHLEAKQRRKKHEMVVEENQVT